MEDGGEDFEEDFADLMNDADKLNNEAEFEQYGDDVDKLNDEHLRT